MNPHLPDEFWNERQRYAFELPLSDAEFDTSNWWNRMPLEFCEAEPSDAPHIDQLDDGTLIWVPERYEEKYAYPLIVWLCGPQDDPEEALEHMPQVDSRNYVGMTYSYKPFDEPSASGDWVPSETELNRIAEELKQSCCSVRSLYHIHSERVYLAGFGDAATVALELVLQRPEWFAGGMMFGGANPRSDKPLTRFRELAGKRIMLGVGSGNHRQRRADLARTGRMLHRAGMDVSTHVYDSDAGVPPQMLSDMNHWIMGGILASNAM